jgi:LysM repeat protein
MSIKKTKLTVAELCQLNELNSEKGLLSQVLPMVFKYHLSKIAKIAADEDVSVNTLRDDAIEPQVTLLLTVGFQYLNLLM